MSAAILSSVVISAAPAKFKVGGGNMMEYYGVDGDDVVESGVVGVDGTSDKSVIMMERGCFLGYQIRESIAIGKAMDTVFDGRVLTCYNRKNRRENTRTLALPINNRYRKGDKDTKV
eukprot:scaffold263173_cov26-Attheya_sp.AAC.2